MWQLLFSDYAIKAITVIIKRFLSLYLILLNFMMPVVGVPKSYTGLLKFVK